MSQINVVNLDELKEYLAKFSENEIIQTWLFRVARRHILKSKEDCLHPCSESDIPSKRPDWLEQALQKPEERKKLRVFRQNQELHTEVSHLVDYFNDLLARHESLTFQRLSKISYPQAVEHANRWVQEMNRRISDEVIKGSEQIVRQWPNGYTIRKLTPEDLPREGKLMGHCVANYLSYPDLLKESEFYSLRDAENQPHATIKITNGEVKECKGKQNKPPIAKYIPFIQEWVVKEKFDVKNDALNIGLVFDQNTKKLHSIYDMPDHMHYIGNLDFTDYGNVRLPRHLKIEGSLILKKCLILGEMPENLDCKSLDLTEAQISPPKRWKIACNLDVRSCTIKGEWPEELHCNGDIILNGQKNIRWPKKAFFGGSVSVKDCHIINWPPKKLEVGWNLNIKGSNVDTLPEKTKVGSHLYADAGQIKKWPSKIAIGWKTHLDGHSPQEAEAYFRREHPDWVTPQKPSTLTKTPRPRGPTSLGLGA